MVACLLRHVAVPVVSVKRQLPVLFGFYISLTAGLGFPTGAAKIASRGYQPYIQFPWSHSIAGGWRVQGMFTLFWFPSESTRNPTFEPTFSIQREFGPSADLFVEYVGDYDHQRPHQLVDGGGSWRFTKNQQLDFHVGFGPEQQHRRSLFRHRLFVPSRRLVWRCGRKFTMIL